MKHWLLQGIDLNPPGLTHLEIGGRGMKKNFVRMISNYFIVMRTHIYDGL